MATVRLIHLQNVAGAKHVARLLDSHACAQHGYNYMALTLLGPTLAGMRRDMPDHTFTPRTALMLVVQARAISSPHPPAVLRRAARVESAVLCDQSTPSRSCETNWANCDTVDQCHCVNEMKHECESIRCTADAKCRSWLPAPFRLYHMV